LEVEFEDKVLESLRVGMFRTPEKADIEIVPGEYSDSCTGSPPKKAAFAAQAAAKAPTAVRHKRLANSGKGGRRRPGEVWTTHADLQPGFIFALAFQWQRWPRCARLESADRSSCLVSNALVNAAVLRLVEISNVQLPDPWILISSTLASFSHRKPSRR